MKVIAESEAKVKAILDPTPESSDKKTTKAENKKIEKDLKSQLKDLKDKIKSDEAAVKKIMDTKVNPVKKMTDEEIRKMIHKKY